MDIADANRTRLTSQGFHFTYRPAQSKILKGLRIRKPFSFAGSAGARTPKHDVSPS